MAAVLAKAAIARLGMGPMPEGDVDELCDDDRFEGMIGGSSGGYQADGALDDEGCEGVERGRGELDSQCSSDAEDIVDLLGWLWGVKDSEDEGESSEDEAGDSSDGLSDGGEKRLTECGCLCNCLWVRVCVYTDMQT